MIWRAAVVVVLVLAAASAAPANEGRGRALAVKYQCARCHDGAGLEPFATKKHCVRCHQSVRAGEYAAPPEVLARWQKSIVHLLEVPSLDGVKGRLRASWIERFLAEPHDVRPALGESMPRLPLSSSDARELALWLAGPEPTADVALGDAASGRELMEAKGCAVCHRFSGVPPLSTSAPLSFSLPGERFALAMKLAPDLALVRERFVKQRVVAWLLDPAALKPDTAMPRVPLTESEANDIAAYLFEAELAPAAPRALPARLPVLERKVRYEEVKERVFDKTCKHCHQDPVTTDGDGGAGYSGGFGFAGKKLDVTSYRALMSGSVNVSGGRRSLFEKVPDDVPVVGGLPRLVAHLVARQAEERGQPLEGLYGMPLGLPALAAEELQLVESWVAQGRPR